MLKKRKHAGVESHSRTVAKAISWRVIATMTTMTIVYVFTGKEIVTLGIGLVDALAKISFYYLHERGWNRVTWGTKKHPLSEIPVNRDLAPEDLEKVKGQLKDLGYLD